MSFITILNLNFSPLDQFDDMLWVGFNVILETISAYGFYVEDFEYSLNTLALLDFINEEGHFFFLF